MNKKTLQHIAFAGLVLTLMNPSPAASTNPELQKGMEALRALCKEKCQQAIKDGEDSGKCATPDCMTTWTEFYKDCKGCDACPPDYP